MSARRRLLLTCTLGLAAFPAVKLRLRLALSRVLDFALRLRSHELTVSRDTVTLILAPHQDDETLGCGGVIARKRNEGLPVDVVFITDGSASHLGHPKFTPTEIGLLRRREALAALAILGVETPAIYFLDEPDGTVDVVAEVRRDPALNEEQKKTIVRIYESFRRENASIEAELAATQPGGVTDATDAVDG